MLRPKHLLLPRFSLIQVKENVVEELVVVVVVVEEEEAEDEEDDSPRLLQ